MRLCSTFHRALFPLIVLMGLLPFEAGAQSVQWSTSLGTAVGPGIISPEIGDVDGNPANGLEVVAGTRDGTVTAIGSGGAVLWQAKVPSAQCAGLSRTEVMRSSPTIGRLRRDDPPVVVVGYGSQGQLGCDGGVVVFDGASGREKWRFSVKSHARRRGYWAFRYGTVGKPAISKPLAGGKSLIAFGSLSRHIYLLDDRGKPKYYYQAADTVFSSPAFFRDGKGRDVFTIGQDISKNTRLRPPTRDGGYLDVFALNAVHRRSASHVPFRRVERSGKAGLISMQYFDQVMQSSPRIGELVASSPGPEIAVTSGCFFPQHSSDKRGKYVSLVDSLNRRVLGRAPLSACSASSPLLFNDEQILAVLDNGLRIHGGPGKGRLMGLRPTGSQSGRKVALEKVWEHPIPDASYWHSPVAVTLATGERALALHDSGQVQFFRTSDGKKIGAVRVDGSIMDSSPAAGDVDGDGRSEVAIVTAPGNETRVSLISSP